MYCRWVLSYQRFVSDALQTQDFLGKNLQNVALDIRCFRGAIFPALAYCNIGFEAVLFLILFFMFAHVICHHARDAA